MAEIKEYDELERSAELCVIRSQYMDALSKINNFLEINFLNDHDFMKNYRATYFRGSDGVILGAIVGFLILGPALALLYVPFVNENDVNYVLVLLLYVVGIIAGIIGCRAIAKAKVNSKGKDALAKYRSEREDALKKRPLAKELKENYTSELKELVSKMKDRSNCIIPQKYWDYAPMLVSYIDNCRAHDLESAINVLEIDLHNRAMEEKQQQILMEQMQARIMSEIAAENSEIAREAAELAAIHYLN